MAPARTAFSTLAQCDENAEKPPRLARHILRPLDLRDASGLAAAVLVGVGAGVGLLSLVALAQVLVALLMAAPAKAAPPPGFAKKGVSGTRPPPPPGALGKAASARSPPPPNAAIINAKAHPPKAPAAETAAGQTEIPAGRRGTPVNRSYEEWIPVTLRSAGVKLRLTGMLLPAGQWSSGFGIRLFIENSGRLAR